MDHVTERLVNARRALRTVKNVIDVDKVLTGNRSVIMAYLHNFDTGIVPVIHLLPSVVRDEDQNLTRQVKNLRNTTKSLIEASLDRAMKRKEVALETIKLVDKVRQIRGRLKVIIAARKQSRLFSEPPIKSRPIVDDPPVDVPWDVTAAAGKQSFTKTLNSFRELENYQEFMRQMGEQVRRLDGDKTTPIAAPEKPKTAPQRLTPLPARPMPMDTGPSDSHVEIINNRSAQLMDESARHLARVMSQIRTELPKQPNFGNRPYRLVEHVPLITITRSFMSDALLKNAKLQFMRPLLSDTGWAPGAHRHVNVPMITPTVIVRNQLMLAVPLKTAMSGGLPELLDEVLPALSGAIGDLTPVEIGESTRRFVDRGTKFKYGQGQGKMPPNRDTKIQTPAVVPKTTKNATKEDLNLEHERRLASIREATSEREKLRQQEIKREQKRVAKFESGRKLFFVNSHYPGVAWVWLVKREIYPLISKVQFISINLPIDKQMLNDAELPSGGQLVKQKAEREQAQLQRMEKLRQQREGLTGGIRSDLMEWEKIVRKVLDKIQEIKSDYEHNDDILERQEKQLAKIHDTSSREYMEMQTRIEATKEVLKTLKMDLDEEVDVNKQIQKERKELEAKIEELTRQAKQERKNAVVK